MLYTLSNKKSVQYVMAALKQQGISQVVLSPGSRNAPMLISLPQDDYFELYSIVDERSAAFFALGLALQSGRAVVLNCTSGSALLNYAPALAEAYYQQIPLVVLSADRPENLIDKGYGQCIHQKGALQAVVKAHLHLSEAAFDTPAKAEESILQIQKLLQTATQGMAGPVHINMPFAEPLYDRERLSYPKLPKLLPLAIQKDVATLNTFVQEFKQARKKLVLVGQLPPNQECVSLLRMLSTRKDVFVMSETLANAGTDFPSNIDPLLALMRQAKDTLPYVPDMVISIGGHLISKHIKKWLSTLSFSHWQLGEGQHERDTFFQTVKHLSYPLDSIATILQGDILSQLEGNFASLWTNVQAKLTVYHKRFVQSVHFSDFKVYAIISAFIQQQADSYDLHMANSTAIRYAQLFSWDTDKHKMYSNRGVSGLEGSVSSALGVSQQSERVSCCFVGDLAFFYDANALWNKYMHPRFKIIVVHNGGGGIFRFIDGPADSQQLPLFETPHKRMAKSLAMEAGMRYFSASSEAKLLTQLPHFFKTKDKPCLLEIHTPQDDNAKVLKAYFEGLEDTNNPIT